MGKPKHIFIVDDNEIYSMMLDYVLSEDKNYKFMSFKSGEECLKNLYLNPEIIILDYGLPGMNGYDTLLKIKKQNPHIHVVILTGNENRNVRQELIMGGADDLVLKQNHGEVQLVEKIKIILTKKENKVVDTDKNQLADFGSKVLKFLLLDPKTKINRQLLALLFPLLFLVFTINEIQASSFENRLSIATNERQTLLPDSVKLPATKRDSARIYYDEGILKTDSLNYTEAIVCFTKALELDSTLAAAYLSRAYAKNKLLDYQSALKDYNLALKLPLEWEESYEAYFNKGITQTLLHNLKGAMSDFNSAIKINPEYADAYYNRSILKGKAGDYYGELEDINTVISLKPFDSNLYNSRGIAYSMTGNYVSAMMDYNKAIELNKYNLNAYFNRGVVYYELKEYLSALNDFCVVIQAKPDAGAFTGRGNTKYRMNNIKGAFEDYTAAITKDPTFYLAYLNRGQLKFDLKDYQSAIDDYTTAIKVKPDFAMAFYCRGLAKNKLDDSNGEIDDYTEAIRFQPDFEDAYYQRGIAKYSKGDKRGGCDDLTSAVKQGSNLAYDYIIVHCK